MRSKSTLAPALSAAACAAADWFACNDAGVLSATEAARFQRWLAHPDHAREYAKLGWADFDLLPAAQQHRIVAGVMRASPRSVPPAPVRKWPIWNHLAALAGFPGFLWNR